MFKLIDRPSTALITRWLTRGVAAIALGSTACSDDATQANNEPPGPPQAVGATVMGETAINVTWEPAEDDHTKASGLAYNVAVSTNSEAPVITRTAAGASSLIVEGLRPGQNHNIVVSAIDERDAEGAGASPVEATTLDTSKPSFGGIKTLAAVDGDTLSASWQAASDNGAYADQITYAVFVSTASGEQDFTAPWMTTMPGAESVEINGLDQYTEYFVTVRAIDTAGNVDSNLAERSALTPDTIAPDFGGVTEAIAAGSAVQLKWEPATDNVDGAEDLVYRVFYGPTGAPLDFSIPAGTSLKGAVDQTITGLALDTEYDFVIRAVDLAGNESDNDLPVSAQTGLTEDETPPVFNGLILVDPVTATQLYVAWDEATDDTTPQASIVYDVYNAFASGQQNFNVPVLTTAAGATNALLTGLDPDTLHYVVVRARDISGNQDSNTVEGITATLADTTPPTFDGIATAMGASATTISLTWNAASDDVDSAAQIRYFVYRVAVGSPVNYGSALALTAPGVTQMTVSNMGPEQGFTFAVRAVDQADNADGNTVTLDTATLADTTPPTFAGASAAVAQNETQILVSWPAASDNVNLPSEIAFNVYASTDPGQQNFAVPTVTTTPGATSAVVSGLPPGKTAYFVVRAFDTYDNEDANTKEVSGATNPDVTPPTFAGAASISGAGSTQMTVNWNAATDNVSPQNAITYRVCYSTGATTCNTSWTNNGGSVVGTTSRNLTGLSPNTTYYVRARAEDEYGNIDGNTVIVSGITTSDVTPPTFAGLTSASATGPTTIQLNWSAASDNVSLPSQIVYDIYRSTTNGGQNFLAAPQYTSAAGATTFSATGLAPLTQYYFVARARDAAGNRDSNVVQRNATTQADVSPPTGGGVSSLSQLSCSSARVNHGTATDNVTASGSIVYRVCASNSATGCNDVNWSVDAQATGGTFVDVTGLAPGTWYFRVRPVDQAGNLGTVSTTMSIALTDTVDPIWQGLAPVATAQYPTGTSAQINMTWSQATDSTSCGLATSITYEICRTPNGLGVNCTSSWNAMYSSGTAESITISSNNNPYPLSPNTPYTLYVRAVDQYGNREDGIRSDAVTTGVSYATNIYPSIFNNAGAMGGCAGCHAWTRANTVNATATCNMSYKYVLPSTPNSSVIYRQMTSSQLCAGPGQMPSGGPYNSAYQTLMFNWISQGAVNN